MTVEKPLPRRILLLCVGVHKRESSDWRAPVRPLDPISAEGRPAVNRIAAALATELGNPIP